MARRSPRAPSQVEEDFRLADKNIKEGGQAMESATGEKLSDLSPQERNRRLKEAFQKTRRIESAVEKIIESVETLEDAVVDPGEAVAYLARRMLLARAIEAVAGVREGAMEGFGPEQLAQMILRLENSRIAGDKLRLSYERSYVQARRDVLEEIRELLKDHPELYAKICRIVLPEGEDSEPEKNV